PALELVTQDLLERRAEQPPPIQSAAFDPPGEAKAQTAQVVRESRARHAHTARLLEVNQRLRTELSSVYRASEVIRVRARQVLSRAAAGGGGDCRWSQADRGGRGSSSRCICSWLISGFTGISAAKRRA